MAWLGCVSEVLDLRLSSESVRELQRWDRTVTTNWGEKGVKNNIIIICIPPYICGVYLYTHIKHFSYIALEVLNDHFIKKVAKFTCECYNRSFIKSSPLVTKMTVSLIDTLPPSHS